MATRRSLVRIIAGDDKYIPHRVNYFLSRVHYSRANDTEGVHQVAGVLPEN